MADQLESMTKPCAAGCGRPVPAGVAENRTFKDKPWCSSLLCYAELSAQVAEEQGDHKTALELRQRLRRWRERIVLLETPAAGGKDETMKYRKAIDDALAAYLEEFGGEEEGGDATTFVDFVVVHLHGPLDNAGLCGWYQGRADARDAEMREVKERLDARTESRRRATTQLLSQLVAERGSRSLRDFFHDVFEGWLSRMAYEAALEACAEASKAALEASLVDDGDDINPKETERDSQPQDQGESEEQEQGQDKGRG